MLLNINRSLYDQDIDKGIMRYSQDVAQTTSIRYMHIWLMFMFLNRKNLIKDYFRQNPNFYDYKMLLP
jgi:hypothetical protein